MCDSDYVVGVEAAAPTMEIEGKSMLTDAALDSFSQ
jgi:hypothetical protein